jgi:hypothetical protein
VGTHGSEEFRSIGEFGHSGEIRATEIGAQKTVPRNYSSPLPCSVVFASVWLDTSELAKPWLVEWCAAAEPRRKYPKHSTANSVRFAIVSTAPNREN